MPATGFRDPQRQAITLAMYAEGASDAAIAARLGIGHHLIGNWRRRLGLPANNLAGRHAGTAATWNPDDKRRCMVLLRRNVFASVISRVMGIPIKTVESWRTRVLREDPALRRDHTARVRRPSYATGRPMQDLQRARCRAAFEAYADGKPDGQIAELVGIGRQRVVEWRGFHRLPANFKRGQAATIVARPKPRPMGAAITPLIVPLHARLHVALQGRAAPDLVEEAVSDVWVARMEGRFATDDEAVAAAPSFLSRAIGSYASRYGPRSLDEEIGEDGWSLKDRLADPDSVIQFDRALERSFAEG